MMFSASHSLVVASLLFSGVWASPASGSGSETATGAESSSTSGSSGGQSFDNVRMTYYDVGQGACGDVSQPSDFIVALNAAQFGDTPGSSPYCHKKIKITVGDKDAEATITDKCPGCPYGGLDLSQGLFEHFAPTSEGVLTGSWQFLDGSGDTGGSSAGGSSAGGSTSGGSQTTSGGGVPGSTEVPGSTNVPGSTGASGGFSSGSGTVPTSGFNTAGGSSAQGATGTGTGESGSPTDSGTPGDC